MDFKEQFEKPLPIINRQQDKIYVETSGNFRGSLVIKNDGGGEIMGRITSNSSVISFEPEYFSKNDAVIDYYISLDILSPGEVLKAYGLIMSNGGEHQIEFIIKVAPHTVATKDKERIASLKDFYNYSRKNPIAARQLFSNHEFMMWLHARGYEYADLYEKLASDANKERALDNFFIINKLKRGAKTAFTEKSITLDVTGEGAVGYANIQKTGAGYVEREVVTNAPWLSVSKQRLVSSDFDENGVAVLGFMADAKKLTGKVSFGEIALKGHYGKDGGAGASLEIKAVKKPFLEARLERLFFGYKDYGGILLSNNTGKSLAISIRPKDSFIKLSAEKFIIDAKAAIPIKIDCPAFVLAQQTIKKRPVIESEILVKSAFGGERYMKTFKITIGNFV